jgi:hypothetical protein
MKESHGTFTAYKSPETTYYYKSLSKPIDSTKKWLLATYGTAKGGLISESFSILQKMCKITILNT